MLFWGIGKNAPIGQERKCCVSGKEIRSHLLSPPNGRNFEKTPPCIPAEWFPSPTAASEWIRKENGFLIESTNASGDTAIFFKYVLVIPNRVRITKHTGE